MASRAAALIVAAVTASACSGPRGSVFDGIAWDRCQSAVEAHLRHPTTANYGLAPELATKTADGYQFAGTLTAQNATGRPAALTFFSCVTDEVGVMATAVVSPASSSALRQVGAEP